MNSSSRTSSSNSSSSGSRMSISMSNSRNKSSLSKRKLSDASDHSNSGGRGGSGAVHVHNSNLSSSVHSQVHRLPHKHAPEVCNIQTKFITAVAIYFVGSFIIVLYQLTGLSVVLAEEQVGKFRYHEEWHPKKRRERFPSVEERVKYYMNSNGNNTNNSNSWYLPPCDDDNERERNYWLHYSTSTVNQTLTTAKVVIVNNNSNNDEAFDFYAMIRQDTPLFLDVSILEDCARGGMRMVRDRLLGRRLPTEKLIARRTYFRPVCTDLMELLFLTPSLAMLGSTTKDYPPVPMFVPWRRILSQQQDSEDDASERCRRSYPPNPSPILWRMQSQLQYNLLARANRADTLWERKKPKAVWSPSFSGAPGVDDFKMPQDRESCLQDRVCRFVFHHAASELVNAGYRVRTNQPGDSPKSSTTLDGVAMTRTSASLRQMQANKILVHLEGPQDYGVGLAWKLYSQSVLLMYPPTKTTWLMEGYLKPWVHYLPLNDTNAESMVWWVMNNDAEAQKISERASMFVHDLMLHDDAMSDEERINKELMKRYQAHWRI